jgi:lipoprotein-anchoring transpeptidase ErfK/SrfK
MITRRGLMAGLGATLGLGGCLEAPPDPPSIPDLSYAARRDGPHLIPAVPIEQIPESLRRQVVPFETDEPPGSVIILADQRVLHLVLRDGYALRYGIGVGQEGLGWTGRAEVYSKRRWPTWTPTASMIARDPAYARWADGQPGGPTNPLGARALYLRTLGTGRDEGIRIHGTPEWRSIGRAASQGCFRMLQHDVLDLYDRVPIGTRVVVRDNTRTA